MDQELMERESNQPLPPATQVAETPSEELEASQLQQARRRCIEKYLKHALAQNDAVRAGLGVVNAELMAVTLPLADVLKQNLSSPLLTIDGLQKTLPALDTYHRLTRLIERFGQLDVRIATRRQNRKRLGLTSEKPR